jgi:RNA polymerase-binding transcription factor
MEQLKRRLMDEQRTLAARLRPSATDAGIEDDPRGTPRAPDLVDLGQAAVLQDSHLAVRERLIERLSLIRAALQRLEDGTYGDCVDCGGVIARGRLRAMPETPRCVACQERFEREKVAA